MSSQENPFWSWSVAFYESEGVSDICLTLQDRHGLDVNLVLLCCWLGLRGLELDAAEAERADHLAADWATPVIEPLRSVRRYLKPLSSDTEIGTLRKQIARLELEAERIQQDRLHEAFGRAEPSSGSAGAASAATNIRHYLGVHGRRPEGPLCETLFALLHAAFPEADEADIVSLLASPAPDHSE